MLNDQELMQAIHDLRRRCTANELHHQHLQAQLLLQVKTSDLRLAALEDPQPLQPLGPETADKPGTKPPAPSEGG